MEPLERLINNSHTKSALNEFKIKLDDADEQSSTGTTEVKIIDGNEFYPRTEAQVPYAIYEAEKIFFKKKSNLEHKYLEETKKIKFKEKDT